MLISVGFTRPRPSCRSTTTSWGKKEQTPLCLFPFCFAREWSVHLHPRSTRSKLFNVWNLKCPLSKTTFLCVIRKFHGHSSLKEYYEKESCVHYIHNVRASIWVYSHWFSPVFLSVCAITVPFFLPGEGATAARQLCRWSSCSWLAARHPAHASR